MGLATVPPIMKAGQPIEFGGPAVYGEATDGDGDKNGSRGTDRHLLLK
jgi:hypothetical protein